MIQKLLKLWRAGELEKAKLPNTSRKTGIPVTTLMRWGQVFAYVKYESQIRDIPNKTIKQAKEEFNLPEYLNAFIRKQLEND